MGNGLLRDLCCIFPHQCCDVVNLVSHIQTTTLQYHCNRVYLEAKFKFNFLSSLTNPLNIYDIKGAGTYPSLSFALMMDPGMGAKCLKFVVDLSCDI